MTATPEDDKPRAYDIRLAIAEFDEGWYAEVWVDGDHYVRNGPHPSKEAAMEVCEDVYASLQPYQIQ